MLGELTPGEIDALLREELVARIAYVDRRGRPNIVPIAYAYDGVSIYGYSAMGEKLENMTANPAVCVEVDRIVDAADWRSAIVHGAFETLAGSAAADAVARISDRMRTVAGASNASAPAALTHVRRAGTDGIAYRIRVLQKSGRRATSFG